MSQQINALPINGFTIADLALLAPGPGQFLEVGGAAEGRIDIDDLAAYTRSPAFGGDANTATIATNNVVRFQIDISGNVSSTIPGGSTLLPEFKCRAWVNFDGSTTPPTIRGSGNILSVTRRNTGRYTVTFASDFPDTNYCAATSGSAGGPDDNNRSVSAVPHTTSSAYVVSWADSDGLFQNVQQIHVSFYR